MYFALTMNDSQNRHRVTGNYGDGRYNLSAVDQWRLREIFDWPEIAQMDQWQQRPLEDLCTDGARCHFGLDWICLCDRLWSVLTRMDAHFVPSCVPSGLTLNILVFMSLSLLWFRCMELWCWLTLYWPTIWVNWQLSPTRNESVLIYHSYRIHIITFMGREKEIPIESSKQIVYSTVQINTVNRCN